MGEIIIVGSESMIRLVNNMIDVLNEMTRIVALPTPARGMTDEWDVVADRYSELRRRFFRQGRIESAMWPLSKSFYDDEQS